MTTFEAIAQAQADAAREERELYATIGRANDRLQWVRMYFDKLTAAQRYAKKHPDATPEDVEKACGVRIGSTTALSEWLESLR